MHIHTQCRYSLEPTHTENCIFTFFIGIAAVVVVVCATYSFVLSFAWVLACSLTCSIAGLHIENSFAHNRVYEYEYQTSDILIYLSVCLSLCASVCIRIRFFLILWRAKKYTNTNISCECRMYMNIRKNTHFYLTQCLRFACFDSAEWDFFIVFVFPFHFISLWHTMWI